MAQINLPTPALYFTCILVAKALWSLGSLGPMSELNFLIQVALVGRGGRAVFGRWYLVEPNVDVFGTEFLDVCVVVDFNVVARLNNVDTVEHVEETLLFERDLEFIIDHVEEDVCSSFVRSSNGKVIDLAFEDYLFTIDCAGVEAGFVNCGGEAQFP